MAATPKKPQKVKLDYNIPKQTYDDFIRLCNKKGLAPAPVVGKLLDKYVQSNGQI